MDLQQPKHLGNPSQEPPSPSAIAGIPKQEIFDHDLNNNLNAGEIWKNTNMDTEKQNFQRYTYSESITQALSSS